MFRSIFAFSLFIFMVNPVASRDLPINWQALPEPYASPSARKPPLVVQRPDAAELSLPDGFSAEEYLSGFVGPRFMLQGASGEVLVADTHAGRIYVVHDQEKRVLISELDTPYGMAFYQNWLYVAETTAVKRYKYDKQTQHIVSYGELIVDMGDLSGGHVTRTITFDPSDEWLYVSVGSRSNVAAGEPERRAAISRYRPDGSGGEIFATGIRNGVGLRFMPGTDQLWATSHERDGLGDDLVPDYLTSVKQGDFFGWPYAYIGPHEDPRRAGEAPKLVNKTRYPDVLLGSHVGALDLLFYTGDQFPQKYRDGCFVALHGSWNRAERVGYQVVFVPFEGDKPIAGPEDFLSGWMLSPDRPEVWGRPVGLLQLADGSLLVTDDASGKIWRIQYNKP